MTFAILIVSFFLGVIGFIFLFEDVKHRKGWKEYLADSAIILSGAAAFTWVVIQYAYRLSL